jgi:hypothetical protein
LLFRFLLRFEPLVTLLSETGQQFVAELVGVQLGHFFGIQRAGSS